MDPLLILEPSIEPIVKSALDTVLNWFKDNQHRAEQAKLFDNIKPNLWGNNGDVYAFMLYDGYSV
jgi:hypothetical protein